MNDRSQSRLLEGQTAALLAGARRALAGGLGTDEGARVLREIGLETGEDFHTLFEGWLAAAPDGARRVSDLSPEDFWDRLSAFFATLGWGGLSQEQLHPGLLALDGEDWLESADRHEPQPACHFTTGLIAGMLHRVAGGDVAVMEVECRSAGDARCRFLVGSDLALESVFDSLESGASLSVAVANLG